MSLKIWWCDNCGFEVPNGGRCRSCGEALLKSPLPELEPGNADEEVGYGLAEWDDRTRGRLIEALIDDGILHRFEEEELVVRASDERKVDALAAQAVVGTPSRRHKDLTPAALTDQKAPDQQLSGYDGPPRPPAEAISGPSARGPGTPPVWPAAPVTTDQPEPYSQQAYDTAGSGVGDEPETGFLRWSPWVLVITIAVGIPVASWIFGALDATAVSSQAAWVGVGTSLAVFIIFLVFDVRARAGDGEGGTSGNVVAGVLFGAWAYLLGRALSRRQVSRVPADHWLAIPVLLLVQVLFIAMAPALTIAGQNASSGSTFSGAGPGATSGPATTAVVPSGAVPLGTAVPFTFTSGAKASITVDKIVAPAIAGQYELAPDQGDEQLSSVVDEIFCSGCDGPGRGNFGLGLGWSPL